APGFELGNFNQPPIVEIDVAGIGLFAVRHADELAVAINPAVIGAAEILGIAAIVRADDIAAMPAFVQITADTSGAVALHDDIGFTHEMREVIVRMWDHALMAQEQPTAAEDPFEFTLVDVLSENLIADEPAALVDEASNVGHHRVSG